MNAEERTLPQHDGNYMDPPAAEPVDCDHRRGRCSCYEDGAPGPRASPPPMPVTDEVT